MRKQRLAQEGAKAVSHDFLKASFVPHVLNWPWERIDSSCYATELDSAVAEPMSQAIVKRSNEIKGYLRAYQDELRRIIWLTAVDYRASDPDAELLFNKLGRYAGEDDHADDSESDEDAPAEERGLMYEAWTLFEELLY